MIAILRMIENTEFIKLKIKEITNRCLRRAVLVIRDQERIHIGVHTNKIQGGIRD